jgi:iodotyrosine deiodinase
MASKNKKNYVSIPLKVRKHLTDEQISKLSTGHLYRMRSRRTIRNFSEREISAKVIEDCIRVASLAPSGANQQPWHFCMISDPMVKNKIRCAAEREERKFYNSEKNHEWLNALEPLGTDADKPHLEMAPWLIVVFSERYGQAPNGQKTKNYYVPESVGIATGFLISALHLSGLYCLTHTPSPMGFLQNICNRPTSNRATLIIAVGHAAKNATYPSAATIKKPLNKILSVF